MINSGHESMSSAFDSFDFAYCSVDDSMKTVPVCKAQARTSDTISAKISDSGMAGART